MFLINKADIRKDTDALIKKLYEKTGQMAVVASAKTGYGMEQVKKELARKLPEDYGTQFITGSLVSENDLVLLVMPQDIQAPKGRLILPQVQTLRELLDKKCIVMSVTTDKYVDAVKDSERSAETYHYRFAGISLCI